MLLRVHIPQWAPSRAQSFLVGANGIVYYIYNSVSIRESKLERCAARTCLRGKPARDTEEID